MKKYKTILADPPWPIKLISRHVRPKQLSMPYPVMSIDDIKNLPVNDYADPNGCCLFLWATQKYLPVAFSVMDSWGFKYHCTLTWDKTYGFTPFSFMWSTEFCLYGQLSHKWERPKRIGVKTLITEKPRQHSVKPESMYELIEQTSFSPYLELFARRKRLGWDAWGNEVDSDIDLTT